MSPSPSPHKPTLYATTNSAFSHKVLIAARELGLRDQLEFIYSKTEPFTTETSSEPAWVSANALGKIPTLVLPGTGQSIYDSSVVMQYLDYIASGPRKIFPNPNDPKRFEALTIEALGDGILDAGVLLGYERRRDVQSESWKTSLRVKIERGIKHLATLPRPPADVAAPMPLTGIVIGNVLWYMDRRHPGVILWREFENVKSSGLVEWFESVKQRESFTKEEFPVGLS